MKITSCVRDAVTAGAFLAVLCNSSIASAVGFSGSYQATARNSGDGLLIDTQELADPLNFALDSPGTYVVSLFTILTDELDIGPDEKDAKPITVDFDFTSPASTGGVSGITVGVGFVWQKGRLTWSGPGLIDFGKGGVLRITLADEVFNRSLFGTNPDKKKVEIVEAIFLLVSDSKGNPLPASLSLFMAALGGLAVLRWRGRTES